MLRDLPFTDGLRLEKGPNDSITYYPTGQHTHTVVFLPGLTAYGSLFTDIFSPEKTYQALSTKIVAPSGPVVPLTQLPTWVSVFAQQWWWSTGQTSVHTWDTTIVNFPFGYVNQIREIWEILDREVAILGGDATKVFLIGHSQGAMMSLTAGVTYGKTLGGIVGMSGYYGTHSQPTIPKTQANIETPMLCINGEKDPVVLEAFAHASYFAGGLLFRKNFLWERWGDLLHTPTDAEWKRVGKFVGDVVT